MSAFVDSTITFPYKRSLGPVFGAFMTALRQRRIIGIRSGDDVLCPPLEWDPRTGAELAHDFVEVGPAGTVESWCWVSAPSVQHPLDRPFAFATIRLDGATTGLIHAVDTGSAEAMSVGLRVVPRWRSERIGHITDIEAFVPGEPVLDDGGAGLVEPVEPVTMMDYAASITYVTPVPANMARAAQATREGRFLGLQCPACGRTYTGGREICPIDSLVLTPEHDVDLPQSGVVTNYTIVTPTPYPGQTETEPFARVHVLLDGMEVILGYQAILLAPGEQVRIGMHVAAEWAGDDDADTREPGLLGWRPTGEPDVDDPSLVNRIC